jgi:hypothetical protein
MSTFTDLWRGNFNGDQIGGLGSLGDLLWWSNNGDIVNSAVWLENGSGGLLITNPPSTAELPQLGFRFSPLALADFNFPVGGPPNSDILWQNATGGSLKLWQMSGTTIANQQDLQDPGFGWSAVAANDFNGDKAADILLQNANGQLAIWTFGGNLPNPPTQLNGFNVDQNPNGSSPTPIWSVVASGDTVGNGTASILLESTSSDLSLWTTPVLQPNGQMHFNGQASMGNNGPTWHVAGMGDFDGDGKADILFQNDNGMLSVWTMGGANGTTKVGQFNIPNSAQQLGTNWKVEGVRDMNSDGKADILLANDAAGFAAFWAGFTPNVAAQTATFAVQTNIPNNNGPNSGWHLV